MVDADTQTLLIAKISMPSEFKDFQRPAFHSLNNAGQDENSELIINAEDKESSPKP